MWGVCWFVRLPNYCLAVEHCRVVALSHYWMVGEEGSMWLCCFVGLPDTLYTNNLPIRTTTTASNLLISYSATGPGKPAECGHNPLLGQVSITIVPILLHHLVKFWIPWNLNHNLNCRELKIYSSLGTYNNNNRMNLGFFAGGIQMFVTVFCVQYCNLIHDDL